MGRLIDADKLKQFPYSPESGTGDMVTNWVYESGLYDLELYVTEDCPIDVEQALKDLCKKVIDGMLNIIDTEPTAYDAEKVVAELEQSLGNTNFEKATSEVNESYYNGLSYAYGDAINVVRKGGVE